MSKTPEQAQALWDKLEAERAAKMASEDPTNPSCWCGDTYIMATGGHSWTCAYGGHNVLLGWTDGVYDPDWRSKQSQEEEDGR